jgi:hypothetical protein
MTESAPVRVIEETPFDIVDASIFEALQDLGANDEFPENVAECLI